MDIDIPAFGMDEFSRMTTPISSENMQLPTPECSSADLSADLNRSLGLNGEDLFSLELKTRRSNHEIGPCACLSKALQHQEDVCINLHWAARGLTSASAAEMLQCLKRVMEGYASDELLECDSHQSQPERISLLLSTCDMMVSGCERLVTKIAGNEGDDGAVDHQSPPYPKDNSRSRTAIGPEIGNSGKLHQPRQNFGQFVLDEEDERCVFLSLLAVRTRRLSSLVQRLHKVADRDGRPVHIRLIQSLQARCNTVFCSLESYKIH